MRYTINQPTSTDGNTQGTEAQDQRKQANEASSHISPSGKTSMSHPRGHARLSRRLLLMVLGFPLLVVLYALLLGACSYTRSLVPDQSRFPSLRGPKYKDTAVVRLYACPVRLIGWMAVHPWFVVKKKHSRRLTRWEVVSFQWGDGFGYVRNNVPFDYNEGVSSFGGGHALAEITGPEAERIGALIEKASPHYPCRHRYRYFPGPNSNTYAQWILHITGWDIHLPPHAYGALWYRRCLKKGFGRLHTSSQ